jgi:hypothetical protein
MGRRSLQSWHWDLLTHSRTPVYLARTGLLRGYAMASPNRKEDFSSMEECFFPILLSVITASGSLRIGLPDSCSCQNPGPSFNQPDNIPPDS